MAAIVTIVTVFLPCGQCVPLHYKIKCLEALRSHSLHFSDFSQDFVDLDQVVNQGHICWTDVLDEVLATLEYFGGGTRLSQPLVFVKNLEETQVPLCNWLCVYVNSSLSDGTFVNSDEHKLAELSHFTRERESCFALRWSGGCHVHFLEWSCLHETLEFWVNIIIWYINRLFRHLSSHVLSAWWSTVLLIFVSHNLLLHKLLLVRFVLSTCVKAFILRGCVFNKVHLI